MGSKELYTTEQITHTDKEMLKSNSYGYPDGILSCYCLVQDFYRVGFIAAVSNLLLDFLEDNFSMDPQGRWD